MPLKNYFRKPRPVPSWQAPPQYLSCFDGTTAQWGLDGPAGVKSSNYEDAHDGCGFPPFTVTLAPIERVTVLGPVRLGIADGDCRRMKMHLRGSQG